MGQNKSTGQNSCYILAALLNLFRCIGLLKHMPSSCAHTWFTILLLWHW